MKPFSILSFKPGHDGSVAYVKNGRLVCSLEAEKDSFPRYTEVTPSVMLEALSVADAVPDVVAVSGWVKGWHSVEPPLETGYWGYAGNTVRTRRTTMLGKEIEFFSSSHERSHIMGCYGMSPFPQGQPCYMLLWEGTLGRFYEIDGDLNVRRIGDVMDEPGHKYAFLYSLADPTYEDEFRFSTAGKLMALAGFSDRKAMNAEELKTSKHIIDNVILRINKKKEMEWSPFYNIGVEHPLLTNLAGKFSDYLFDAFYTFARQHCTKGYPLLIGGGCGLNCEWNTKWRNAGLFEDVFVPPVANDTGSAIGTAVDSQHHYTGNAKIEWDVYCGPRFIQRTETDRQWKFEEYDLDFDQLAKLLEQNKVFALVQGNCEIGPRALGNRSLIAAPFKKEMHARLNAIKGRESYRPIAPICMEENVAEWFEWEGPSPYMLYFQKVKHPALKAITHVDGTARVQTVTAASNKRLYQILAAFKRHTGFGVLCNTSLNFNGRGFINNFEDLAQYATDKALDGFILEDRLFVKQTAPVKEALIGS